MSPDRRDKIEVGRIDKGGFEDEDTAENIANSLCFSVLAALLVFLFDICAVLLTVVSVILAVLGIALLFTPMPIGGIVFLLLALLWKSVLSNEHRRKFWNVLYIESWNARI